ncbi:hypothetical protein AB0365_16605 [Brevibacterium casei]|uniref:efflux RND transporter periplasmic adaptor subunit n=2 Tax=Bacteria TaxID=2 RepID=UPI00344EF83B
MQIFRRVILPSAFLLVLVVIAAMLAWIAFKPAPEDGFDAASASGQPVGSSVVAERGSIANTLELKGAIAVDSPTAVKAGREGTVNHFFVEPGTEVLEGAELFQVRSEGEPSAPSEDGGTQDGGPGDGAAAPAAPPAPAKPKYHTVVAPADGTVGDFAVDKGDTVTVETEVTQLLKDSFTAQASIPAVDLYRVPKLPETASITITDGPEPFDCTALRLDQGAAVKPAPKADGSGGESDPAAEDPGTDTSATAGDGPQLICAIPEKQTVFNGLDLTMTVEAGEASDVIVVPVTAVRGLTDTGTVWVIGDDGQPTERAIEIGLNDGAMVEVKSGLEEGEEISEFVPGTEPQDEGDMSGDMSGEEFDF